jgi:hypothetical protein
MSKKTAIIIIIATVVIAIVGFVVWYLLLPGPSGNDTGGSSSLRNIIVSFFPKGSSPQNTSSTIFNKEGGTSTTQNLLQENGTQAAPAVYEISSDPISGFMLLEDQKQGTVVRFMETETGHTYSAPLSLISKNRLTNTTIPKVHESIWLSSGKRLVARFLDESNTTIKSFAGLITATTSDIGTTVEGSLNGKFLPDNISELVAGPSGDKIFYLTETVDGASGILANGDGAKPARIFSSPLREWLPQWEGGTVIYLTTKASSKAPGYIFSIDSTTGSQTKILGGIFGLTTNSNQKNSKLLYSDSEQDGFHLFTYDLKAKTSEELPLKTLAEKCAWDNLATDIVYCGIPKNPGQAEYPDSWYQGVSSFDDDLWRINIKTGEVTMILSFDDQGKGPIDLMEPRVNTKGSYLVFINKNDLSLWSVKIK